MVLRVYLYYLHRYKACLDFLYSQRSRQIILSTTAFQRKGLPSSVPLKTISLYNLFYSFQVHFLVIALLTNQLHFGQALEPDVKHILDICKDSDCFT